jgi:hypothetical protein
MRSLIFFDALNIATNSAGVDGSVSRTGAAAAPPTTVDMFLSPWKSDGRKNPLASDKDLQTPTTILTRRCTQSANAQ